MRYVESRCVVGGTWVFGGILGNTRVSGDMWGQWDIV